MTEEKTLLTKAGKEKLEEELKHLIDIIRPQVIEELKFARSQGDLSENADYDAARNRQAEVEGKIVKLQQMIDNCQVIDEANLTSDGTVKVGSVVEIYDEFDKEKATYTIVGSVESNPLEGKISNSCPLAQAILGHRSNETCIVLTANPYTVKIISIK